MQRDHVLQFLVLSDRCLCSRQEFNHTIEIVSAEQLATCNLECIAADPYDEASTVFAEPRAARVDRLAFLHLLGEIDLGVDLAVEDIERAAATNITGRCCGLEEFQCVRHFRSTFAPAAPLLLCFPINSL
ncbi:hypothetical protein D9M68_552340 [compost metagenome]